MASTSVVTRLPRGGEGVPRLHPVVARGLVLFAHGSGRGRQRLGNRMIARSLQSDRLPGLRFVGDAETEGCCSPVLGPCENG